MQNETKEVLDRVESLARELGAVGAETAGQLVEAYGRGQAVNAVGSLLLAVLLGLCAWRVSGPVLREARKGMMEQSFEIVLYGGVALAVTCIGAVASLLACIRQTTHAVAPEWYVVQELLR